MAFSAKETIRKRKSVRTYDGRPLSAQDREALEEYMRSAENPFGVPVEFRLLDAAEHGLTSPVITGAGLYVAAKVPLCRNYEIGYGYSFEFFCLFAESLGIGTVIMAGTLNRGAFEKAMDLREGEVMPAATPVGYPASKRSIRETLMRKGIKADERKPFDTFFFDGAFGNGLKKENAGVFAEALEMARWAPSAANKQPLRAIMAGDAVHFYELKSMPGNGVPDIQKVDIGIAAAHFDLAMREDGYAGSFLDEDPGLGCPANVKYIVSYRLPG